MKDLTLETIKAIAAEASERNRSDDHREKMPDHHLVWVLDRIAGKGDGFVPGPIQRIIDKQA